MRYLLILASLCHFIVRLIFKLDVYDVSRKDILKIDLLKNIFVLLYPFILSLPFYDTTYTRRAFIIMYSYIHDGHNYCVY